MNTTLKCTTFKRGPRTYLHTKVWPITCQRLPIPALRPYTILKFKKIYISSGDERYVNSSDVPVLGEIDGDKSWYNVDSSPNHILRSEPGTCSLERLHTGLPMLIFEFLEDNINFNGLNILKKFLEESSNRNIPVHLVLSEYDLKNFNIGPNIVVHKYFPDPWGLLSIHDEQMNFELLFDKILNGSLLTGFPVLIVIDSIASILQYVDLSILCNCLRKVTTTFVREGIPAAQVITILHSELIPEDSREFKYLNYIATSDINLKQETNGTSALSVVYRQLNGKIQTEAYTCSYSQNKELSFEVKKDVPKPKKEDNEDILVKTTFKLTLEEKEKQSRSKVVLPYVKTSNTIGKGRIFYEPDLNDDWDDEDPDDDLEI